MKQMSIFDILERPIKKASTSVGKPVDKKSVIVPCKVGILFGDFYAHLYT